MSIFQSAFNWYYSGYFSLENDLLANIACHMLLPMTVFWILALPYTFVDLTGWPGFIYKYKQRPQRNKVF